MAWKTWQDGLPPFGKLFYFYSESNDRIAVSKWNMPQCSNAEDVINNLKSGKWKQHGIESMSSVTHWWDEEYKEPPKPTVKVIDPQRPDWKQ